MRIKIACSSCSAAFVLTKGVLENNNGYICCPSCGRDLPSGALADIQKLFRTYNSICKELEGGRFFVKSLKISKETSED